MKHTSFFFGTPSPEGGSAREPHLFETKNTRHPRRSDEGGGQFSVSVDPTRLARVNPPGFLIRRPQPGLGGGAQPETVDLSSTLHPFSSE